MTSSVQSSAAGRVQPQTTVEPGGGPFIQHSQDGSTPMFTTSNLALSKSNQITPPLPSAPGYARKYRLLVEATGGVNGTVTVAAEADAPFSAIQSVVLQDAFGTQLLSGSGFDMLYLVPKFGGQFGLGSQRDIKNLPSYSPVSVGTAGTGDFTFSTVLPLEFAKGIGTIGVANAAIQPKLNVLTATDTAIYSTPPGTLPTLTVQCQLDFYWLPQASNVTPPGEGTTMQWISQAATPPITTALAQPVTVQRAGGYISVIILELRDSTGARIDAFPDPLTVLVDGVPWVNAKPFSMVEDDMAIAYEGITRDTGVVAITRRTSLSQRDEGLLDTGMTYLSTSPGTSIQIGGSWGTIANAPAQLTVLLGQVVPVGSLVTGLPEAS